MMTTRSGDAPRSRLRGIYALVDPDRVEPIAFTEALLRGGIRLIQIRAKNGIDGATLIAVVTRVRAAGGVAIVNDDVRLARLADGVHLGQEDAAALDLRALRTALARRHHRPVVRNAARSPRRRPGADRLRRRGPGVRDAVQRRRGPPDRPERHTRGRRSDRAPVRGDRRHRPRERRPHPRNGRHDGSRPLRADPRRRRSRGPRARRTLERRRAVMTVVATVGTTHPLAFAGLTFAMLALADDGIRPVCVVAGVTAQDADHVHASVAIDAATIRAQFDALRDAHVGAFHVGALVSAAAVRAVADGLASYPNVPVVRRPSARRKRRRHSRGRRDASRAARHAVRARNADHAEPRRSERILGYPIIDVERNA